MTGYVSVIPREDRIMNAEDDNEEVEELSPEESSLDSLGDDEDSSHWSNC